MKHFLDYLLIFNWLLYETKNEFLIRHGVQFHYLLRIFKHILCALLFLWLSLEEVISETFWKLEAAQVQLCFSSDDICLRHPPKGDTIHLVRSCTDKKNSEYNMFKAPLSQWPCCIFDKMVLELLELLGLTSCQTKNALKTQDIQWIAQGRPSFI